jgi:hypothetical protein
VSSYSPPERIQTSNTAAYSFDVNYVIALQHAVLDSKLSSVVGLFVRVRGYVLELYEGRFTLPETHQLELFGLPKRLLEPEGGVRWGYREYLDYHYQVQWSAIRAETTPHVLLTFPHGMGVTVHKCTTLIGSMPLKAPHLAIWTFHTHSLDCTVSSPGHRRSRLRYIPTAVACSGGYFSTSIE